MKIAAIIPAAGAGKRLKAKTAKAFVVLNGKPLIIHTLSNLSKTFPFNEILVAVHKNNLFKMKVLLKRFGFRNARAVEGGRTRSESVFNALLETRKDSEFVLVHDAARPFVSKKIVTDLLREVKKSKAAICAVPVSSTVKRIQIKTRQILNTENRQSLYLAQTPQVFAKSLLLSRYKKSGRKAFAATDEAQLFDGSAVKVSVTPGEARNIKITTPEDLKLFSFYRGAR